MTGSIFPTGCRPGRDVSAPADATISRDQGRAVEDQAGGVGRLRQRDTAGVARPPRRARWHRHPGVRSGAQLTRGERAADRMRNGMGSWGFVIGALVFLAGWMLGNRSNGFDPYPFILLNLVLSCLAAMQGAILLIAAKREDQISSELAVHDYETNLEADQIVKAIHGLTSEIHSKVCGNSTVAGD